MSLRTHLHFRLGFVVVVASLAAAPACSAILGIEDIPPPDEFPLDASGTCMELHQMPIELLCGKSCKNGRLLCDEQSHKKACLCAEEGGSTFSDVSFGESASESSPPSEGGTDACPMGCGKPEAGSIDTGSSDTMKPPTDASDSSDSSDSTTTPEDTAHTMDSGGSSSG